MYEDPHIALTIRRIADHQIRHRIATLLSTLQLPSNQSGQALVRSVFVYFAKKVANQDTEIQQLIKIINNLYESELQKLYLELTSEERASLSKKYTKTIIKDIIRKQLQNRQTSPKGQQEMPQDKSISFMLCKQSEESLKRTNDEHSSEIPKLFELAEKSEAGLALQLPESCEERIQVKYSDKSYYQSPSQFYTQPISIDIPKFKIPFKLSNKFAVQESTFDPLNDTESFGHFLYGDKPKEISEIIPIYDQLFGTVHWNPREDGFIPLPSSLSVHCIRNYAPRLLVDFYESAEKESIKGGVSAIDE